MKRDALRSIEPARVAGGLGERVLASARYMVDDDRTVLGYALVGLYDDGLSFVGSAVDGSDSVLVNRHMFVGMATELIRENLLTQPTVTEAIDQSNGFES